MKNSQIFYQNNFNLIRLFAAAQVAHYHLISIYQLDLVEPHRLLVKFFGLFPGVPIFFFISGFLISKSWESSHSWKDYAVKRFARIEPALFVSILFAILLTYFSGYFSTSSPSINDLFTLILAKTTFVQFYNPDYLRGYGDGVLNGSIWTICVEIQFYIILPLCYLFVFRNSKKLLIGFFLLFILISLVVGQYKAANYHSITSKFLTVTFLPWYYMFLLGVIVQKYFAFFYRLLAGRLLLLLPIYFLACYIGGIFNADFGNTFNPLLFFVLAMLIFSAAYSYPNTAGRLLKDTDISYGVYLYHMPIINFFLYLHYPKTYTMGFVILFLTAFTSFISWLVIEKPALTFSKNIFRK